MKTRWEKLIKSNMVPISGQKSVYRPNKGININILFGGGEFSARASNLEPAAPTGFCSPVDASFDIALDLSHDEFLIVHKFVPDATTPNVKHTHHIPWEKIVDVVFSERLESKDRSVRVW